jgi:hypothetical protein
MLQMKDIPLQSAPFTWFVAGGWALDLFLGNKNRYHSDLDLGKPISQRDELPLTE